MGLQTALQDAEDKLDKFICDEGWTMQTHKGSYPITFIFRKGVKPGPDECDGQTSIDSEPVDLEEDGVPEIRIIFQEDTQFVMDVPDGQRIDDKFLNKLKNLTKEVHRLYLLFWFSMKESRFDRLWIPMWAACDGKQIVGMLSKNYAP